MIAPRFSIIVPTTGRDTLGRALTSLARQPLNPYDEVLVCGDGPSVPAAIALHTLSNGHSGFRHLLCPSGGHFGCEERMRGIAAATGTHLLFLDDDDAYVPEALTSIRRVVSAHPTNPIMARMIAHDGVVLWRDRVVREGNHGTPQFIVPNDPARLGAWSPRYEGDFDFVVSTLAHYPKRSLVWDETVICACRTYADRVWDAASLYTSR